MRKNGDIIRARISFTPHFCITRITAHHSAIIPASDNVSVTAAPAPSTIAAESAPVLPVMTEKAKEIAQITQNVALRMIKHLPYIEKFEKNVNIREKSLTRE